MDLSQLLEFIIPLLTRQNENNTAQSGEFNNTMHPQNNPMDFSMPFFALPTYEIKAATAKTQGNQNVQSPFMATTQPQTTYNMNTPPKQTSFEKILNLLSNVDLQKLILSIKALIPKNQPSNLQQKKDTNVSFENKYTKVDSYTYD